jgi:hypothetical protein
MNLDGAELNPGLPRGVDAAPDFAALHPGYARCTTVIAGRKFARMVEVVKIDLCQSFMSRHYLR